LRRGLVDSPGDSGDDRIVQQLRLAAMPQSRESLQHDAILSAIVQKFPFRQIRMRFDMNVAPIRVREEINPNAPATVGQHKGGKLNMANMTLEQAQAEVTKCYEHGSGLEDLEESTPNAPCAFFTNRPVG
jgi:hypothetical protein